MSEHNWTTGYPDEFMDLYDETDVVYPVNSRSNHDPMIVCGSKQMAAQVAYALNVLDEVLAMKAAHAHVGDGVVYHAMSQILDDAQKGG